MQQLNDVSSILVNRGLNLSSIVNEVFDSGNFILGEYVERFEDDFSQYLGGSVDVISCANGTDALYLAIQASGLPSGSLVATVANAGFYSTNAILRAGLVPFFMDVDIDSGLVMKEEILKSLSLGVKGVVLTHLYGCAFPDVEEIADLCKSLGVWLVEDCAQAHGAEISGKKVGTFGDVGTFSFYPSKNLGALGDGGAAVARERLVSERLRTLRQYGWREKYHIAMRGGANSRLDAVQANLLSYFLPFLDIENERRREVALAYIEGIDNSYILTPMEEHVSKSVWHLFVIRVLEGKRDLLVRHLRESGIDTAIHYPVLDYQTAAYSDDFLDFKLQNSEVRATQILTLPMYPTLCSTDVTKIIGAINAWK